MVAHTLGLDPVLVFTDTNRDNWHMRLAANNVVAEESKKQQKK